MMPSGPGSETRSGEQSVRAGRVALGVARPASSERGRVRWGPICLVWVLALALRLLAGGYPELVERLHARALQPWLVGSLGRLSAQAERPLAEPALLLLLLLSCVLGLRSLRLRGLREAVRRAIAPACMAMGCCWLVFLLLFGLSYQRPPLATLLGWPMTRATSEELEAMCTELVQRVGVLRARQPAGANWRAPAAQDMGRLLSLTQESFSALPGIPPGLAGSLDRRGCPPKPARASYALSRFGLTGIFVPFTAEPCVNAELLALELPFAACHELAHARGIAREDEASFIAWLACSQHPDPLFAYSGELAALRYALAALAGVLPEAARECAGALAPEVRHDLQVLADFWSQREGGLSELAGGVNDAYLRAQGEVEGVASYGRMVELMLAARRP